MADSLQYPSPPPMLYFKPSNLSSTMDNSTYTNTFIEHVPIWGFSAVK